MTKRLQLECLPVLPLRNIVLYPDIEANFFIARDCSLEALYQIENDSKWENKMLFSVQKDPHVFDVRIDNLAEIGVVAEIISQQVIDKSVRVDVRGLRRVKIKRFFEVDQARLDDYNHLEPHYYFQAEFEPFKEKEDILEAQDFLFRKTLIERFSSLNDVVGLLRETMIKEILLIQSLGLIIDTIMFHWPFMVEDKYLLLSTKSLSKRYELMLLFIEREIQTYHKMETIHQRARRQIETNQQRYFISEQMKVLQKEMEQLEDSPIDEYSDLEHKIQDADLTPEVRERLETDMTRLRNMPPMSAEASVLRNYLEYLVDLPWIKASKVNYNIQRARKSLEKDHYGLKPIKNAVLEFISVLGRTKKLSQTILCFVGPPGVGKTSIVESIARAMGRNYERIALGGMQDESELRGHRKTYIGAMPGKIISRLKHAKVKNPLLLLDEVDKLGRDFRGDPASALLEILDPEQNKHFADNYVELEFDCSDTLFICTANTLNIPEALKDRMEIIEISGYTQKEKLEIAKRYLLPKQIKRAGLKKSELKITSERLTYLIAHYTFEAGVRSLERLIAKICRKTVLEITEQKVKSISITQQKMQEYLGVEHFDQDDWKQTQAKYQVGEINGLAWNPYGGSVLKIQSASIAEGRGKVLSTGSLGNVMRESVDAALTVVKAHCSTLVGFDMMYFRKNDLHLHAPESAIPKDGPSAGAAIATALLSVVLNNPIRTNFALTGEVALDGRILPIGGLKEKLYAALLSDINEVFIPYSNFKEIKDYDPELTSALTIRPVKTINEIWEQVFLHPYLVNKNTKQAKA